MRGGGGALPEEALDVTKLDESASQNPNPGACWIGTTRRGPAIGQRAGGAITAANEFSTLFLAEIDTTSGRLRTVDAGHGYALLIRGGESTVIESDGGPPVGAVRGIPFGMTEAEVSRLFDGVALPHEVKPVVEVCLTTRDDGEPRGFGFVELATSIQAERAKTMLDGRAVSYGGRMPTTLVVRDADAPTEGHRPQPPIAGRLLWVGNLSFGARASGVRDAFAAPAPPHSATCVQYGFSS